MKTRSLSVSFLFLAAMAISYRTEANPVEEPLEEIVESPAVATTEWVAPYVNFTSMAAGGHAIRTITWFSEDGSTNIDGGTKTQAVAFVQHGIALAAENGQTVAFGLCEPWKVALPKKPDDSHMWAAPDSMAATPDSRTFIRPFTPAEGQIAVDVYVHGVLANTLGPFARHAPQETTMNDDGSIAMVIWKDAAWKDTGERALQVVCADRNGSIRFRVDCEETDSRIFPAPDGVGVVLEEARNGPHFTCYTREGKGRTVDLSGDCVGWVPGTLRSLFTATLEGKKGGYQLVDWDSGKVLWEIPCPGGVHAMAMTITPRLVIFVVAEQENGFARGDPRWTSPKGGERLIRAFYAVRVEDGRLVARAQDDNPADFSARERPRLMQVRKKIYFLTTEAFSEIKEEDILAGKNGWKAVTEDR